MPEPQPLTESRVDAPLAPPAEPEFDAPVLFRMIGLLFLPAREMCAWTRVGIEAALRAVRQEPGQEDR